MIIKSLKIFLHNIWKNRFLTNTILENNKNFNILFIRELSWLSYAKFTCLENIIPIVILLINI